MLLAGEKKTNKIFEKGGGVCRDSVKTNGGFNLDANRVRNNDNKRVAFTIRWSRCLSEMQYRIQLC